MSLIGKIKQHPYISLFSTGIFVTFVSLVILFSIKAATSQSSCTTPTNRTGMCVAVENCPIVDNVLRLARRPLPAGVENYIRQIDCGVVNNKPAVCCHQPALNVTPIQEADAESETDGITGYRNLGLLPTTDCGPISTNYIAAGEVADLGEFPWMALLRYYTPSGLRFGCGGSIINKRYVLTAAHCVSGFNWDIILYSVIVGEQNTVTDPDCMDGVCNQERQEIMFEKIIPHPSYNCPRKYSNDIALIRLSNDIDLGGHFIKPICLPTSDDLMRRNLTYFIVSGWGVTENNNSTQSEDLLKTRLDMVTIESCNVALSLGRRFLNDTIQFCAKGKGIADTCKGDSGGPLVFPVRGRLVQFGIVSVGVVTCGQGEAKPAIYVRVQSYIEWILDNIRE